MQEKKDSVPLKVMPRHFSAQWRKMRAYDSICEAEELLFLLLPLLKMSLDQSLEFRQVLLHALAVNVLRVVVLSGSWLET